jgi:Tfp pilus assembly protein FimT
MNAPHDSIKSLVSIFSILSKAHRAGSGRAGFSVLELASVLAILLLIIGATTGAFLGWQHGAAVRGAEDQVYAALANARQMAILRRMPVGLALGVTTNAPGYPARGYCYAFTNDVDTPVSEIAFLPLRSVIAVSNASWDTRDPDLGPFVIRFLPDGRTQAVLDSDPVVVTIGITRNGASTSRSIRLDPLTGIPRSLEASHE